ncbi:type II secretion system secretin GspD [Bradyrhizobium sp. McL0615]|uniref:type II secretion system secretin GspD n=1 Tax=Bradyrhizobium sp. McL0615 TaxID=3415673 RepID=UPI003CF06B3F
MASVAPADSMDSVRNTDFSPRFPVGNEGNSGKSGKTRESRESTDQPFLFPGSDVQPERPRDRDPEMRTASLQQAAFMKGDGVEMNFEGADVQTVAKTLLGDILQLNFVVDPRVQGNVTLASAGPISRKDVLPAFESVLKMQNAAIVRSGDLVKVVPMAEASGSGALNVGAGEPGFGVSLVPLRYTSASTVAKTAESFMTRPGAIRVVQSRNLLLVQGTTAERQAALDVVSTFDVEWLQNQSVGVYPLKSTSPETMIGELERVFETSEGGLGQGVIRFQPISRMNAVMVVTKNPKLLAQTTQWVRRLDRSDTTGTTLRTFKLKNGKATEVAKILNDIFGQKSGSGDSATKQLAPGVESAQARMDALGGSSLGSGSNANGVTNASTTSDNRGAGTIAAAFETFAGRKNGEADASGNSSGTIPRGTFQNLRISADAGNNSIVVYSNQEDYRVVERALRDIDRPLMQVAIDATVAEVTLTDDLQFGVQAFLTSKDVGLGKNNGAVSLLSAGQDVAQGALLQKVAPGLNLLLGSASQPRVILNALSTITDVKVLSSPSIVALDNQPALLQVGDEVPITTSSAAVLTNAATPIVNTITMRNTGVILKVLPHVHANGSVQLEVDQEISNIVNADKQTLTPTIAQRRVHSTVSVTSGQTVLLAGLISERSQETKSGIPGLREIKFLGDVFGNTSNTKTRSEIIIFIKTQLIRNSVDASAVTEEFRDRLQTMRGGRSVIDGNRVVK